MLLTIDDAVAGLIGDGVATPEHIAALELLAIGISEGNHALTGSRAALGVLGNATLLTTRARAVMKRSASNISQEGALLRKTTVYGKVVLSTPSGAPESVQPGVQLVIEIPLLWIDRTAKIQPPVLLGEHLDDATFYGMMAQAGPVLANWGYVPIAYRPGHGGGGTIGHVLAQHGHAEELCICVVDSDRACPGGTLGGTANTAQPFKASTYPLIGVVETSGRDIENLLPDAFYIEGYHFSPGQFPAAEVLDRLTAAGEAELRGFLDVKKGLDLRQVFAHPAGSAERLYWDAKLQTIQALLPTVPNLPCLTQGNCAQPVNAACTCVVVRPSAGNLLRQFLERTASKNIFEVNALLDSAVRPQWLELGVLLASWCLGGKILRI